jgi:hypothetical protein
MSYANSAIAALTTSIEQSPSSDPALERWLENSKELQKELALRVLYLSRYVDELPESSYASYADALSGVLEDPTMAPQIREMSDLKSTLEGFVRRLKELGQNEKALHLSHALENVIRR